MSLKKFTTTELLYEVNKLKKTHDNIKQELIKLTYDLETMENRINDKLLILNETEKKYNILVDEINNRK